MGFQLSCEELEVSITASREKINTNTKRSPQLTLWSVARSFSDLPVPIRVKSQSTATPPLKSQISGEAGRGPKLMVFLLSCEELEVSITASREKINTNTKRSPQLTQ